MFNWSEVHFFGSTSYEIHTLEIVSLITTNVDKVHVVEKCQLINASLVAGALLCILMLLVHNSIRITKCR